MKYCDKCKVNVHHQLDNCPLCGSYLDEKNNNSDCEIYAEMDDKISYPVLHEIKSTNFFRYKFNRILLILLVFCIILNVLLTPDSHWSAYVAIGVVFAIFCVMTPINAKMKLTKQIRTDIVVLTALAIGMEFAVCDGKFTWFTVEFVIPWFFVVAIILTDVLIGVWRNRNREVFSTLAFCTVFAVIPQIVLWITKYTGFYEPKTVINFVIFFASILNLLIVFLVCSRSLKEELERNLNM